MTALTSALEITKLAHEMHVDEAELAFLATTSPDDLRDLRGIVSHAMFSRHESRVKGLAAVSKKLPAAVTAKIAEVAMGPMLSARVAAVMEPADAAKLAGHLKPEFLAELSVHLDPNRVAAIIARLDRGLVVDVGRRLLADGHLLTLARFTGVVGPETSLKVVDGASGAEVVRLALFIDEPSVIDPLLAGLPDETVAEIAAAGADHGDAFEALLVALGEDSRARIASLT
ncbi:ribonuclease, Rne/Rng family [Nocardioidaceae bacterium Broad-1]|nr:ribonuclease, Rne/Rng family [Nocardioidaceae bacterium Broad-1]